MIGAGWVAVRTPGLYTCHMAGACMQMCKKQALNSMSETLPRSTPGGQRTSSRRRPLSWTSSRTLTTAVSAKESHPAVAASPLGRLNGRARAEPTPVSEPTHVAADDGSQFEDPAPDAGVAVPEATSRQNRAAVGRSGRRAVRR